MVVLAPSHSGASRVVVVVKTREARAQPAVNLEQHKEGIEYSNVFTF